MQASPSSSVPEDFSLDYENDELGSVGSASPGLPEGFDEDDLEDRRYERFRRCLPRCTAKNVEKKKRTIIAAACLLLSGTILLIIGIVVLLFSDQTGVGIAVVVIGTLCFIPGSYATYVLWRAFRGQQDVDSVPDF